jgi:exopolyphosphatase/guanosine-5'-triphosphate,3'-diphosphate pyrophosphatase
MATALKSEGQVVGFMDIGTNAVRLLVVRINPNFSYTVVSQEKEVVRLGEEEFKDNSLKPQAMERTVLVCKKFAELARTYEATKIIAVGTSAIREAKNREAFLRKLVSDIGLNVHVISGIDEARLIYLGVSNTLDIGDKKAIFIDLGGGSTEIAIGDQNRIYYTASLKLGAIRLTTQFIGENWVGPVPGRVYKRIKKHIIANIHEVKAKVRKFGVRTAFGSSGTIINLAEIAGEMFNKNENGKPLCLTRKNLKKLTPILCSLPLEERKDLPGINPYRADLIVAGAAILETLMEEFGLGKINVSNRDLKDGLLVDYLSLFEGFQQLQKAPVRNRSVLHLARSCNSDEKHSETVANLSLQLFDSARRIELHDFGDYERDLLRHSAILHDVGDFLSFNDHHLHSHYIISNSELSGFDQQEKTIIANIARFHRKKLPTLKSLRPTGLDEKSKKTVIILSTLLRLAEKLDRSHCGLVRKAELSRSGEDQIMLTFFAQSDCSFEEWSIIQNKQAFYEAFRKELKVHCITTTEFAQSPQN